MTSPFFAVFAEFCRHRPVQAATMKPFLTAFLFLSTAVILEAGETPPAPAKFRLVYKDAAHQLSEVEVQSISDRGDTVMPLRLPSSLIWICTVAVHQDENTVNFQVQAPEMTSEAADGKPKTLETILLATLPLRSGEEMMLVKSNAFTLSATVTLPAPPKDAEPTAGTPKLALTEDELKQVVIKTIYDDDTLNPAKIRIAGYNPFGKRLGEGILRVTVPKSGESPEMLRDYAVRLNASGLADFWSSVSAGLGIPKGVEPTCQLVKLNFLE